MVLVTLAAAAAWFLLIRRRTNASVEGGIRTFLIVLGSVVAFSSGGSQVGLATGPLENLYGAELGLPSIVLLALAQPAFSRVRGWGRPNCSKRLP